MSPRGSHMCACVCVARLLLLLLCNAVIAAAVAAAAVCRRSPTALARSHSVTGRHPPCTPHLPQHCRRAGPTGCGGGLEAPSRCLHVAPSFAADRRSPALPAPHPPAPLPPPALNPPPPAACRRAAAARRRRRRQPQPAAARRCGAAESEMGRWVRGRRRGQLRLRHGDEICSAGVPVSTPRMCMQDRVLGPASACSGT